MKPRDEMDLYKGKKLKVDWTLALAEDLLPHYGIDAEAELIRILGEEIQKEMANSLRRAANNVPTVSDRIRRLPNR